MLEAKHCTSNPGASTRFRQAALLLVAGLLPACGSLPASVPGHQESHHHLRFQNGYVRVMETRLEPGAETLPHSHPVEAAVIFLTDGKMRISNDDGTVQEQDIHRGAVLFGASDIVHRAGNIGRDTARVITVEVFSLQPPTEANAVLPEIGETLLENSKVRMVRVTAPPDGISTFESPVPMVVVAETGGEITSASGASVMEAGAARWCEPGRIGVRQTNEAPFQAVVVQLKPRG